MPVKPSVRIRTAQEAAAYLEGLINVERMPDRRRARLSLAPIHALLEALGHPEAALPVLHVAGSKGKGSTALFAEAVLRAGGMRVGTFTSPHLERWNERFRIDAVEVPDARLAEAVDRIRPRVDALRAGPDAPSFFDATTAVGLLLFAEAPVDVAVLEVGLGGRLDSTNVVTPVVCCITSIELEHTEVLGESLGAIAFEKAGILKAGVPAVMGRLPAEASEVMRERADSLGAPLAQLGRDFDAKALAGGGFRLRDPAAGLDTVIELASLGRHQADNAALAVAAIVRGGLLPAERLASCAPRALASVVLPGRIERIAGTPSIVIDSAHTAASTARLCEVLEALRQRPVHVVLSLSAGKDLPAIVGQLAPRCSAITATRADPHKSIDPEEVAAAVRAASPATPVSVVAEPERALREAREATPREGLLCVTGSVYLAGIARRVLRSAA